MGVCIDSRVAPILSEIFLAKVDRILKEKLEGFVKVAFRYVDDYLIFLQPSIKK